MVRGLIIYIYNYVYNWDPNTAILEQTNNKVRRLITRLSIETTTYIPDASNWILRK